MITKSGWIISAALLVIILLVLVALFIVFEMLQNFQNAVNGSITAVGYCTADNCQVYLLDNPGPAPSTPMNQLDYTTARILSDLVLRVELSGRNNVPLSSPQDYILITTMKTDENSSDSPILAVWRNTTGPTNDGFIAIRGSQGSADFEADLLFSQSPFNNQNFWQSKQERHDQKQVGLDIQKWKLSSKRKYPEKLLLNPKTNLQTGVQVHQGFLDIFEKLKQRLQNVLDVEQFDRVFIGGHSLGSAIAQLTGYFFSDQYNLACYVYGSPRVGNIAFANDVTYPLFRFSNQADLVVNLPFPVMPGVGPQYEPYIYADAGTPENFDINWLSIKNNHWMNVYIYYIELQSSKQKESIPTL